MMQDSYSSGMSGTTITAFFDRRDDAEIAIERLISAGVSRDCIQMTSGERDDATPSSSSRTGEEKGFFEALGDFFFPDEDRQIYAEGLSRGGVLLTVRDYPQDLRDTVLDVLDDEGAVDVEDRAQSWRAEGWTGASAGAMGGAGAMGDSDTAFTSGRSGTGDYSGEAQVGGASQGSSLSGDSSTRAAGGAYGDEGTIPVVREELRVGKRDVSHGRVRVRSYVYETPVSEEVELTEEHVEIERRPVDRAVSPGDDLFRERSIEAEERREEAVVSKEARVTEEIELRRTADTHRETVSDTVRNTEVEIEDERDERDERSRRTR